MKNRQRTTLIISFILLFAFFLSAGDLTAVTLFSTAEFNEPTLMHNSGINVMTSPSAPTENWTEQTSGITSGLYSISAVSDDIAWVCGNSGTVLRTTDKGTTWTNASGNLPATNPLFCIFAWDANIAICVSSPPTGGAVTIYKTSNGGVNWITGFTLTAVGAFGDNVWMTTATDAYYIGDPQGGNWHLLKSTNGGDNWGTWSILPTTNTAGTYNHGACFLGQQVWFQSPGQSTMLYTSNMGVNWSTQTTPLSEITAIYFISSTFALAGGSAASPGLIKTTNSGVNWTTISAPFVGSSTIAGITGINTSWWVALQTAAVYFSSDNGASFALQYTAPAGVFYHLAKSRTGSTIWGVRSNGGISRYGLQIVGINPISSQTSTDYSISQNYPNPFNPVTKISYTLPKSGFVTLNVYDVLGSNVASLVNENKPAGNYSENFDASRLTSGIYFYRLEVNGFTETKKMTLIK